MPTTLTSRIFNNGNSQAVRIPLAFRLDAQRVSITRKENGDLLLHPLPDAPADRAAAIQAALQGFGELDDATQRAFIAELEGNRAQPEPDQEREAF
ncbi:Uncharacterized protein HI0321 [plant metagenome]|uniref:Uncharacterized protein HI0321 n=2 Tax=root TaxID=1 RepID=A0A1C3K0R5_9BURK|nr:hypothetical protein [Orrella dioscoreae]SBT24977.1 Uncharacterized protein HI0321 [Orrella dioscoreae]SOE51122.1 Uncharacterized protein HI0321 [Orrella dioscoreae]